MKLCMRAVLLNNGPGAWAFEYHAQQLSDALWLDVSEEPGAWNYILGWNSNHAPPGENFISWESIRIAGDKRIQAELFREQGVPTPSTELVENESQLREFLICNLDRQWVLKYPVGCGGSGHRFVNSDSQIPDDWPKPFVVQEFIQLAEPEVYRLCCVSGECFGWNARRFPPGVGKSPWVAHARGARYVHLGAPPMDAVEIAGWALKAAGLYNSFGVVDLLLLASQ